MTAAPQQVQYVDLNSGADIKTINTPGSIMSASDVYGEFFAAVYGDGFVTGLRYGHNTKYTPAQNAQRKQDAIVQACNETVAQQKPIQKIFLYYPSANNALAEPVPAGAPPDFDPAAWLEQQLVQCTNAPAAYIPPVNMLYNAPDDPSLSVMKYSFSMHVGDDQPAMMQNSGPP